MKYRYLTLSEAQVELEPEALQSYLRVIREAGVKSCDYPRLRLAVEAKFREEDRPRVPAGSPEGGQFGGGGGAVAGVGAKPTLGPRDSTGLVRADQSYKSIDAQMDNTPRGSMGAPVLVLSTRKGTLDELRDEARKANLSFVRKTGRESGVWISHVQEADGSTKIGTAKGDEEGVAYHHDWSKQIGNHEFHHSHPYEAPISSEDIMAMNEHGPTAMYAYVLGGSISKATIPGRDATHPDTQWLAQVKGETSGFKSEPSARNFNGFVGTVYERIVEKQGDEMRSMMDNLTRKENIPELQAVVLVANYVNVNALAANGIINHNYKMSPRMQSLYKDIGPQLDSLVSKAAEVVRSVATNEFELTLKKSGQAAKMWRDLHGGRV